MATSGGNQGTSEECSEPPVTVMNEDGGNVDLFLKIRNLQPKGFFSKSWARLSKENSPQAFMQNGELLEWFLTDTSIQMKLKVQYGPKQFGSEGDRKDKTTKQAQTETFLFNLQQFPSPIYSEVTRFDVRETRNGSFIILKFRKKQEDRINWMQFQRDNGTLEASET